jgi:hypothetical protein
VVVAREIRELPIDRLAEIIGSPPVFLKVISAAVASARKSMWSMGFL